jgi:hypothetical protein
MIHMFARRAAFRLVQRGVMEGFSITDTVIPQSVAFKAMQHLPCNGIPVSETFRDFIIDKTLLCKLQIPCERMVLRLVDRLIGRGAS